MIRVVYLVIVFLIIGCEESNSNFNSQQQTEVNNSWYKPDVSTTWYWQLQGEVNISHNVQVYDIDLFDTNLTTIRQLHQQGKKVICYFSAGSYEDWREDKEKFPNELLGNYLDGWEGERWLDISNNTVYAIMQSRLDLAVQKKCDGVEPDNVDGYLNNTDFSLTYQDQLKYNKFLAKEAHARGLAIGLKNDLEQIEELKVLFDFALNEQCNEYNECDNLKQFIVMNKPVFNAEYSQKYIDNINSEKEELCKTSLENKFQTLILPKYLDGSFVIGCN